MPEGGTVKICGEESDGKLLLHVEDDGEGIEPHVLERILEPLFTTKVRGMGLGLAICKAILDKNGGQLRIDSQPGEGSRFTVVLASACG
jgi:two-component system sensor kinase FixL